LHLPRLELFSLIGEILQKLIFITNNMILTNSEKKKIIYGSKHVSSKVLKANKLDYLITARMESHEICQNEKDLVTQENITDIPTNEFIYIRWPGDDQTKYDCLHHESVKLQLEKDQTMAEYIAPEGYSLDNDGHVIDSTGETIYISPNLGADRYKKITSNISGSSNYIDSDSYISILYAPNRYYEARKIDSLRLGNDQSDYTESSTHGQLPLRDVYRLTATDVVEDSGYIMVKRWLDGLGIVMTVDELKNLQELDLSNKGLTRIPESIGELKNLKELVLSVNKLEKLPESFGKLTNLQKLGLSTNQLTSLPESIGNLTNLKELNLSSNPLKQLPESIGNLTNLEELHLLDNQLEKLPESIGNLTNLEILDLMYNPLEILPESIGKLTNLEKLRLDPSIKLDPKFIKPEKTRILYEEEDSEDDED
jgi:Leucine-rich repeat (LRR) protein